MSENCKYYQECGFVQLLGEKNIVPEEGCGKSPEDCNRVLVENGNWPLGVDPTQYALGVKTPVDAVEMDIVHPRAENQNNENGRRSRRQGIIGGGHL